MFENNEYQPRPQNSLKWWGEQHFEINQSKAWQFGSMLFRLTRGIKEWRIEYYRPTLQDDNEQDWHIISDANFGFPILFKSNVTCLEKLIQSFYLCLVWRTDLL